MSEVLLEIFNVMVKENPELLFVIRTIGKYLFILLYWACLFIRTIINIIHS